MVRLDEGVVRLRGPDQRLRAFEDRKLTDAIPWRLFPGKFPPPGAKELGYMLKRDAGQDGGGVCGADEGVGCGVGFADGGGGGAVRGGDGGGRRRRVFRCAPLWGWTGWGYGW